jgi:hypothetical protein
VLGQKLTAETEEAKRIKAWWVRAFTGIAQAFSTEVFTRPLSPVVVGDGLDSLTDTALTNEKREAISTAMGVPHSLVMSNAANFATADADRLNFYDQTVRPATRRMASIINAQLFSLMGYTLKFKPDELGIYQEDEEQRAQSFAMYVSSGVKRSIAAEMLGVTLPDGIEYADLDDPEPMAPAQIATTDDTAAKTEPILGYHIEAGIVTQNETRAQLGLPPVDDSADQRLRELKTAFDLFTMGRNAGFTPEQIAQMIGFDIPSAPEPEPVPMIAGNETQPEDDAEDQAEEMAVEDQAEEMAVEVAKFRRWAAKRKQPDVSKFVSDILTDAEKMAILTEDADGEDAPFPVPSWESYPGPV